MEVHLYVDAVATDVVEQGTQLVECDPTGHDALAGSQNPLIQVVPLGTAALRLAYAGRPLDGVQLLNLQQGVKVVHGTYAV